MDQRKGNDNLRVNPEILLDIASFEKPLPVGMRGVTIPQPYYNVLMDLQMDYNIWSLRIPKDETMLQRIRGAISSKKEDPGEVFGKTIYLPVDRWVNLIKQRETPVWYLGDPSDPMIRAIPSNMLREFLSSSEGMRRSMQDPIPDIQTFAGSRSHSEFIREAAERGQHTKHNVKSSFRDKFFF